MTRSREGSSIDDIDNRCSLNRLDVWSKRWAHSIALEDLPWVVKMSNSIVVWGKTLAVAGHPHVFLWPLLYSFDLSRCLISSQSLFWLASYTFPCLLPIAASLVPKLRNRV